MCRQFGEYDMISNVLIASDDLLVLDQDISHLGVELGSVGLLKLKDALSLRRSQQVHSGHSPSPDDCAPSANF